MKSGIEIRRCAISWSSQRWRCLRISRPGLTPEKSAARNNTVEVPTPDCSPRYKSTAPWFLPERIGGSRCLPILGSMLLSTPPAADQGARTPTGVASNCRSSKPGGNAEKGDMSDSFDYWAYMDGFGSEAERSPGGVVFHLVQLDLLSPNLKKRHPNRLMPVPLRSQKL